MAQDLLLHIQVSNNDSRTFVCRKKSVVDSYSIFISGGGRGAAGLISGPLRGGMSSWSRETQASNSMSSTSAKLASKKKDTSSKSEQRRDKKSNESKPSPDKTLSTSSSASPPKKKRRASESGGVEVSGSKKKVARAIPLATGDRCTLATEIASGPAGGEFPDGWTVKTYRRAGGETVGKTDRFWFSRKLFFSQNIFAVKFIC